jgi:hypothetical protein
MKTLILLLLIALSPYAFDQKILLKEDFTSNTNQWLIQDGFNDSLKIADGKYVMEGLNESTRLSIIPVRFGNARSYSISVLAEHISGMDNYAYGIYLTNKRGNSSYSFVISSRGYYKFYGHDKDRYKQFADWTEHAAVKKGNNEVNKLTMTKEDNNWKLYINERLIGTIPISISIRDPHVGFIRANKQKIAFDDFTIMEIK